MIVSSKLELEDAELDALSLPSDSFFNDLGNGDEDPFDIGPENLEVFDGEVSFNDDQLHAAHNSFAEDCLSISDFTFLNSIASSPRINGVEEAPLQDLESKLFSSTPRPTSRARKKSKNQNSHSNWRNAQGVKERRTNHISVQAAVDSVRRLRAISSRDNTRRQYAYSLPRVTIDDTRKHYGRFIASAMNTHDVSLFASFIDTYFDRDVVLLDEMKIAFPAKGIDQVRQSLIYKMDNQFPDFLAKVVAGSYQKRRDGTAFLTSSAHVSGTMLIMSDSLREYLHSLTESGGIRRSDIDKGVTIDTYGEKEQRKGPKGRKNLRPLHHHFATDEYTKRLYTTEYRADSCTTAGVTNKTGPLQSDAGCVSRISSSSSSLSQSSPRSHCSSSSSSSSTDRRGSDGNTSDDVSAKVNQEDQNEGKEGMSSAHRALQAGKAKLGHGQQILSGAYLTVSSTNYTSGVVGTRSLSAESTLQFEIGKNAKIVSITFKALQPMGDS